MNRLKSILLAVLLSMLMACVPGTPRSTETSTPRPTETSTPNPTDTPAPTAVKGDINVVAIYISEASTDASQAEVKAGQRVSITARLAPAIYRREEDVVSLQPIASHDVTEMRICTGLDAPCALGESWVPFVSQQTFEATVDWLGSRSFWVVAQFRDAHGAIVPAVGSSEAPEPVAQHYCSIVGVLDEEAPLTSMPLPVQTAVAATRVAAQMRGAVEIEGGSCCVGGTEGDTIWVGVDFEVESPMAEIEAMRVRAGGMCFSASEMAEAEWEPFEPYRTFSVKVFINWMGFYVSAQYRDAQGNVSPVYCDDIGVEGHPKDPMQ